MGSKCSECKEWEENYYWTNITQLHFFKALLGDFKCHLVNLSFNSTSDVVYPLALYCMLVNSSKGFVCLVEHSTKICVKFQRKTICNSCAKRAKWTYMGNRSKEDSTFHVLMFDLSFCEKESSYYVNNQGSSSRSNCYCKVKENGADDADRNGKDGINLSTKFRTSDEDISLIQKPWFNSVHCEEYFAREARSRDASDHSKSKLQLEAGGDQDIDSCGSPRNALPWYVDETHRYRCYFISRRRLVTEAERARALETAQEIELTEPGFIHVMKPTNVYKLFCMHIPLCWAWEHLQHKSQDVILQVSTSTKTWVVDLSFGDGFVRLLGKGWSAFVMDNNLEGDACLFKLAQGGRRSKDVIVMNVSIFRVVEEVVPLKKIVPPLVSAERMKKEATEKAYVHSKIKAKLGTNIYKPDSVHKIKQEAESGDSYAHSKFKTQPDFPLQYPMSLPTWPRPSVPIMGRGATELPSEDDVLPPFPPRVKKRPRTMFSQEKKQKMMEFAEKVEWSGV